MFRCARLLRATVVTGVVGGVTKAAVTSPGSSASQATTAAPASSDSPRSPLTFPYRFIDEASQLRHAVDALRTAKCFALDVEAFCTQSPDKLQLGQVSLIQMCSHAEPCVYVVDVMTLGKAAVQDQLRGI